MSLVGNITDFAKNIFGVEEHEPLAVSPIDITGIDLSEEQARMFETMEKNKFNMFITGKAGTGKSVLLHYFRKNSQKKIAVAAPTGVAAMNVGGQTIHSLFRLPLSLVTREKLKADARTAKVLKGIDCLVIDEISMVRADIMDGIDRMLQLARKNNEPFGGVQVIMFGDMYQLPPVLTERELHQYFQENHGGHYFFHAHVWKQTKFHVFELDTIFRQNDDQFKSILNAIRIGNIDYELLEQINSRTSATIPTRGAIHLVPTNAQVELINSQKLQSLPGNAKEYKAQIDGDLEKSFFPTEELVRLKKGAQVMLLKNDKDKRWVNGTIGFIEYLDSDEISVRIGKDIHTVSKESWSKIKYIYNAETKKVEEQIVGSFTQFPLRLAWAITIHKSQGQSYDKVILDLGRGSFAHGQTYVALSRARSLEGLYLTKKISPRDIIVDPVIAEFMR